MGLFYVSAAAVSLAGGLVQRATVVQAANEAEAEAVGIVAMAAVWPPSDGWFHTATATQWQQGDFDWMMQMLNDEAACLTKAIDTAILSAEIVTDEPDRGTRE